MIGRLPSPYLLQDLVFFVVQFFRDKAQNWLAQHFIGRVAKHSACSFIPAADDSVQVFTDDGVVRRVNDRRQPEPACIALAKRLLVLLTLSDVPKNQHNPNDLTILVTYRRATVVNGKFRSIASNEKCVIRESDYIAESKNFRNGALYCLPRAFIDNPEHTFEWLTLRLLARPPRHLHGSGIH